MALPQTTQERADSLFKNSTILAPMVRASSTPLRIQALQYGASLVYTEEIIDRSIIECDRIVNDTLSSIDYVRKRSKLSKKQLNRLSQKPPVVLRLVPSIEKSKLIFQLGTGDASLALTAASLIAPDVDGIDINMGCPKKFSVGGGMGSALLKDMNRACDIIKTLRRNVDVPVSAKIRLLESDAATVDFVKGLEMAGANAIAVHAREVGDDGASVPAKWGRLGVVAGAVGVPVIANGDLYNWGDREKVKEMSGVSGFMLARPALYNMSIFRKEGLLDKETVVKDYLSQAVKWQTNYKNVKYVICEMMSNRRHPCHRILEFPQHYPGKQTIGQVCACHGLEALCKLWDVNMSMAETSKKTSTEQKFDDDYFLKPEKYRSGGSATATLEEKKDDNSKIKRQRTD